jgi:hypothetical protein
MSYQPGATAPQGTAESGRDNEGFESKKPTHEDIQDDDEGGDDETEDEEDVRNNSCQKACVGARSLFGSLFANMVVAQHETGRHPII